MTAEGVYAESPAFPLSNRQVAERVITCALDSLGIPEGKGFTVHVEVDGTGIGQNILDMAATEFLTKHGYHVGGKGALPEFRFTVDTLFVNLGREGGFRKKQVRRIAEARIGANFRETQDSRKVFQGHGFYNDAFPVGKLNHVGRGDSFVVDRGSSFAVVRPVLFGLAVTGLIWLLYSYRG